MDSTQYKLNPWVVVGWGGGEGGGNNMGMISTRGSLFLNV